MELRCCRGKHSWLRAGFADSPPSWPTSTIVFSKYLKEARTRPTKPGSSAANIIGLPAGRLPGAISLERAKPVFRRHNCSPASSAECPILPALRSARLSRK